MNKTEGKVGKGRIIQAPFMEKSFESLGLEPDLVAIDQSGNRAKGLAWTHRTGPGFDIYFVSNQLSSQRIIQLSLRQSGRVPELWNPVTGDTCTARQWKMEKERTVLPVRLDSNGSLFIVLQKPAIGKGNEAGINWNDIKTIRSLDGSWQVTFNPAFGGPAKPVVFNQLSDWSVNAAPGIRYYSGSASYSRIFDWTTPSGKGSQVWLDLGRVANIAEVIVNGVSCGVAWTYPYRVNITKALRTGKNQLSIEVANTWANRLIGDHALPEAERVTNTNAPYRMEGMPLLEAGLLGPVTIGVGAF